MYFLLLLADRVGLENPKNCNQYWSFPQKPIFKHYFHFHIFNFTELYSIFVTLQIGRIQT